jgi:hypothetical protein
VMRSARPSEPASRTHLARTCVVLAGVAATVAVVTPGFRAMHRVDRIVPGPGVTRVHSLATYLPSLQGSDGNTAVFELRGSGQGGTVLVLGGTHADEPAGYLAAVLLVEQARVDAGRLLVIPRANASGFTHNYPQEGHPQSLDIPTPFGSRRFTYGARATNPVHQWPDPQVYTHRMSGQTLAGAETRNLNRAYPGLPDGTMTERIAFAITTLIRRERVGLAIDLHEASPEYPVVNTIVAHQRAIDLAAMASMRLQEEGIDIGLEPSPENLHGLSHREWGDGAKTLAILMETTNPAQGRLRGRTDARGVVAGTDRFYDLASRRGRLSVPFPPAGWPLSVRVARHLTAIRALVDALNEIAPDEVVLWSNVPGYQSIISQGLGASLRKP